MQAIYEQFTNEIAHYGHPLAVGTGSLECQASSLRLAITGAQSTSYSNAQIDDYRGLSRGRFLWRPPLQLSVRARFSDPEAGLRGTAGFGFWNDPFLMSEPRMPALPRAAWFFYASPESNMKLDLQVDGSGWKAATLDASGGPPFLWLPLAPILVPLMNFTAIYRLVWPLIQRTLRIREARLHVDMAQWRTYILDWDISQASFSLLEDEDAQPKTILRAPSPKGPMGFVMWIDNQYLIVTPWGRLRWGYTGIPNRQWMEVDWFTIEPTDIDSGQR